MKKQILFLLSLLATSVLLAQENAPSPLDNKNWISSIGYDLNGNTIVKGVSYYNFLGKGTQTQSWDALTSSVWASQTLYDYQGRPALQSLSAPIGNSFGHRIDFMRTNYSTNYETGDFDDPITTDTPIPVGNTVNTLGWYYSNNNTNEPYQDITSFPFSRSVYSKLYPGRTLKVLGGNKVNINGTEEWAQSYSFSMPVSQELHYAFGKNEFPEINVAEDNPIVPNHPYVNNFYIYTIVPVNEQNCSTSGQTQLTNIYLGDMDYQINKIYKMTGPSGIPKYYKILSRVDNNNPSVLITFYQVVYGPYTNCTEFYVGADYIKATKTVNRDVHGIETVVFTDSDGNTLAAARSGSEDAKAPQPYGVLSPIGEQGFVDIHIPVGCGGNISFEGPDSASFFIYDLITETKLNNGNPIAGSSTFNLNPGFYRIDEATSYHKNPQPYVEISGSTIRLVNSSNQVGVRYNVNYYDYSLNFYDKAGRLTNSVQPEGFDDVLSLSISSRNHHLESTFTYNTLGQLQNTSSPDEGIANFKYRSDGQIRYSQNSLQATNNEFSYTNYDDLGRPLESGVLQSTAFSSADPDAASLPSGTKKEQHYTVYDMPDSILWTVLSGSGIPTSQYQQQFVAGNVSKTYTVNPSTTITWYSYDINGRVTWIVQNIDGLGVKTIDYEYDFAQGNVTKVIYQKHKANELFVHRYNYNIAGQLTSVETSTDNSTFTEQESYAYYETGALKRKELLDGIQGTDYVYNINGQLKAINHPGLSSTLDPGGDSDDAFGMLIDYHQNDYARTQRSNITTSSFGTDQFNGNIKTSRWNTMDHALSSPKENTYNYQYNKNNWLEGATYGEQVIGDTTDTTIQPNISSSITTASSNTLNLKATNSITMTPGFHAQSGSDVTAKIYTLSSFNEQNNGDYNVSNITYDANGNIKTLKRNKNTESGSNAMDNFTYNYKTSAAKNQLDHVADAVTATTNANDLKTQNANNYKYNSIGQLTENTAGNIKYSYNTSGLVTEITKNNITLLKFFYNDKGHRVRKEIYNTSGALTDTDYYVRDVAGIVMAIYKNSTLIEQPIYGSSRIGVRNSQDNSAAYQLTDHLGNVRAVIGKDSGDNLVMLSYADYYPFGMPMPNRNIEGNYRYKFQGQEKDSETDKEAFELRLWDSRIGRWLTTDPANQFYSPYLGMGNNPINGIDPDGAIFVPVGDKAKKLWNKYKSKIIKTDQGKFVYDEIQNDESYEVKVVYVSKLANNDDSWAYDENSKTIYISDGLTANQVKMKNKEAGSWNHPNWILAGHELKHAWDHYKLGNDFSLLTRRTKEKSAVKFQNYLYSVFNDDNGFRKGYGLWRFSFFPTHEDFNQKKEKIRYKYEGVKHKIKSNLDNFPSRTFFQIQKVLEIKTYGDDDCKCKK